MDGHVPLRRLLDRAVVEALFTAARSDSRDGFAVVDTGANVVIGDAVPSVRVSTNVRRALGSGSSDAVMDVGRGWWLHPLRVGGQALGGLLVSSPGIEATHAVLGGCLAALVGQAMDARVLGQETLDRYREINLLYRVGETIGASLDAGEIPGLVLSEASRAIRSDAACVLMGQPPTVRARDGEPDMLQAAVETSRALVEQVMADGQPMLVSPEAGPGAAPIGSLLVVPIRAQQERVGAVVLARRRSAPMLTASDQKLLMAVASEAGVASDRARLHEQVLERQRLEQELAVGRRIQLSLLPASMPTAPGWEFGAVYQAAREVGGDFYDFLAAPGRRGSLDVMIGDVTGKGVPAALLMASTRAVLRASVDAASLPSDVLRRTNHHLVRDGRTGLFVTALYLSLDLERGDVVLANGGHDLPLWIHGPERRTRLIASRSAILGAFPDLDLEDRRIRLDPGDSLVLYTDGVTEARDRRGRLFGERRLRAAAAASASESAGTIAQRLTEAVHEFSRGVPMADDLTVVVIKRL
jgi:sigma-B regulation protein RsbU (phosphoserine phosphatase)